MHEELHVLLLRILTRVDLAVGIVYTYQITLHSERILLQGFHPNARSTLVLKAYF